jgi:flagellar biosynthesis chaperone FliJ
MMLEHMDFLFGYRHFDKPSEQLKHINDYRKKLINKYKHNIPSMVSEHRSKRLKQLIK